MQPQVDRLAQTGNLRHGVAAQREAHHPEYALARVRRTEGRQHAHGLLVQPFGERSTPGVEHTQLLLDHCGVGSPRCVDVEWTELVQRGLRGQAHGDVSPPAGEQVLDRDPRIGVGHVAQGVELLVGGLPLVAELPEQGLDRLALDPGLDRGCGTRAPAQREQEEEDGERTLPEPHARAYSINHITNGS